MKLVSILSLGRGWLSVWLAGGLVVLTIAVAGCGRPKETLAPSPPLQAADKHLLAAAQQGELDLVKAAIDEGASVNCRGTNGLTSLLQTLFGATAPFEAGRRQCVAFLLERGAEVDAKDGDGQTALICASRAGDLETVQLLVKAGAFITMRDRFHKTPQLYAAEGGHRDILMYLGQALKVLYRQSAW